MCGCQRVVVGGRQQHAQYSKEVCEGQLQLLHVGFLVDGWHQPSGLWDSFPAAAELAQQLRGMSPSDPAMGPLLQKLWHNPMDARVLRQAGNAPLQVRPAGGVGT